MTDAMPTGGSSPYYYGEIDLDRLFISENNARRQDIIADVEDLAQSIEHLGLLQPIVVQPRGNRFEILVGQRRFLAFKHLGRAKIPAKILSKPLSELEVKAVSFSENVQRRDLTPTDKAQVCRYLLERLTAVRAVADYLGTSETTVRKWLGYNAVPTHIKQLVEQRKLTRGQASHLWENVAEEQQAIRLADMIADKRPPADERKRIMTAIEEMPDRPIDVILDRAEQLKHQVEIRFILPQIWAQAIDQAAAHLDKDPSDIAKDATIEWLRLHQYFANR